VPGSLALGLAFIGEVGADETGRVRDTPTRSGHSSSTVMGYCGTGHDDCCKHFHYVMRYSSGTELIKEGDGLLVHPPGLHQARRVL
jgi:hypothetical protein